MHVLYRVYDDRNTLLYVGCTTNPGGRIRKHQSGQPWWHEAATIRLQHFSDFDECAAAEIEAIKTERPRHNVVGMVPKGTARRPRRSPGEGSFYLRSDGLWVGSLTVPNSSRNGKQIRKTVASRDKHVAWGKLQELRRTYGNCDT